MNDSILLDVKKYLGIDSAYDAFDSDVIMNINAAFATLFQLGVGPTTPFFIMGSSELWSGFSDRVDVVALTKQYIFMKTKMGFAPPTMSTVAGSVEEISKELEFRLNILCDPYYMLEEGNRDD